MTYPAAFYTALHEGTPGDLAFYASACEGVDSVLELGCGDGRVLAVMSEVAVRHGLDLHEGLLEAAEARLGDAVTLHRADMRAFDLGRTFDRIVLPFSGLYCLLGDADVARCLACVRDHLTPDGALLLDAYAADEFHPHAEPEDVGVKDWNELGHVLVDGAPYAVYEQSRWDPEDQRIDVTYRYAPMDGSPTTVDGVIEQRYLLRHQLEAHLRDAGLPTVQMWGGFGGEPWSAEGEHWVARARR
ncbi:MAG: class I SAM-dependent methyltransferase [Myxococcota bacterium]